MITFCCWWLKRCSRYDCNSDCVQQPIFTMSAQQNQLKELTEDEFTSFSSSYSYKPVSF